MKQTESAITSDGRRLRSERSRQAIVDAMIALMEEGNLVPTAQQVSDRAEVGIRSVFRHFSDMESLFAIADEQTREATEARFVGGNREGSLEERILGAARRRGDGYEFRMNMVLSAQAQLWRYEILRKNYARYQRGLRKDLDDWLPELASLSRQGREAVDAVASFEMWHRLREHQGLSRKASVEIVTEMLGRLIESDSGS